MNPILERLKRMGLANEAARRAELAAMTLPRAISILEGLLGNIAPEFVHPPGPRDAWSRERVSLGRLPKRGA